MTKPYLIEFNKIGSEDIGYISVAEIEDNIPFEIKRVYWTYDTPKNVQRGNHSHQNLMQVIICTSGSLRVGLENIDGEKIEYLLDRPNMGLFLPAGYWRTLDFGEKSVLLCLASLPYSEDEYIRDYKQFKK